MTLRPPVTSITITVAHFTKTIVYIVTVKTGNAGTAIVVAPIVASAIVRVMAVTVVVDMEVMVRPVN